MTNEISRQRYDVIVAGARCAGASTAMLLARAGLRVLVVDPTRRGSDTLSTHALMRGGVRQLHRWGLLEAVRASGAPAIRTVTFHYADDEIPVPIKPSEGVDALYAPRRTVLDELLVEAAERSGAEICHGLAVVDLLRDDAGRVRGATISGPDLEPADVEADLVVGADGIRSRVARILEAPVEHALPHASASIYGYVRGLGLDGYHWYYEVGASVGSIPSNDDETCVFASLPRERFEAERGRGLEALHAAVLPEVSRDLAARVQAAGGPGKLRAFAGVPGFLRQAAGPGWALVGDAGYFRDPITAHGITDALRDAELLARAVLEGSDRAIERYASSRYERVRDFFEVTDRLAAFDWTLEEAKAEHLVLAKEMKRLADGRPEPDGAAARVA
jgi:2-polyprenyl-6-methoxyphenol hydroxylase-like FAD-dependent oxidoreductase